MENRRSERRPRRKRSSLPYILLNVLLSALTTLLVLVIWTKIQENKLPEDVNFGMQHGPAAPLIQSEPVSEAESLPPLPPVDQTLIVIDNVFGTGDIENEVIELKRLGEGELWLTGWKLSDEEGHIFTFQELVINKDASIEIFSGSGHDSVAALYWGLSQAIWSSGKTVYLYDHSGLLRSTYIIP